MTHPIRWCLTCQYDLRGHTVPGICPECGTPIVSESDLRSAWLGRCDHVWLTRVRKGTGWWLAALWGMVLLVVGFFGILVMLLIVTDFHSDAVFIRRFSTAAAVLTDVLPGTAFVVSVFLLTSSGGPETVGRLAARIARMGVVTSLLASALATPAALGGGSPAWVLVAFGILSGGRMAAFVVCTGLLQRIGEGMYDRLLVRLARMSLWLLCVTQTLLIALGTLIPLPGSSILSAAGATAWWTAPAGLIFGLLVTCLLCVSAMLLRAGQLLRAA